MTEILGGPSLPQFVGGKQERIAFFKALVTVQSNMPTIEKERTARVETKAGGTYTYDYADLVDVTEALKPILPAAGFAWTCLPMWQDASRVVLRYYLAHVDGGVLWGDYPLNLGGTPQAAGSAITYARRYCLCAVVGAAPKGDDDDAAGAGTTAQRRTPATRSDAGKARPRATTPADGPTAQRASQPAGSAPGAWSPAQRARIMATYSDLGVEDRDERLAVTGRIVGRELTSSNELSYDEAGKVIEGLEAAKRHADGFTGWLNQQPPLNTPAAAEEPTTQEGT